jgi:beta-mannosidase
VVADLQIGGAIDYAMNGTVISRNIVYLAPVKEVHLKPAALKVETTGTNGSYKVRVTSPVLARSVYLSFGDLDVKLSDNYFDLLPGETAEIAATSAASLDALKAHLKVVSLTDAFAGDPQPTVVSAVK